MTKSALVITLITSILLTGCKKIEDAPTDQTEWKIDGSQLSEKEMNESQKEYVRANAEMHVGMGIIDEDPDIAFMQGMVPHHQGAVDMAKIVLKYGTDREARALAETIIESQNKEIAQMNAWLKKRGVEPAEPSEVDHKAMGH